MSNNNHSLILLNISCEIEILNGSCSGWNVGWIRLWAIVPLDCDVLSHVEQELLSRPEHPSSHPVISRVRVDRSLVFWVMFYRSLFALFLLTIILSVFLWFTVSDYPFGVFNFFLFRRWAISVLTKRHVKYAICSICLEKSFEKRKYCEFIY